LNNATATIASLTFGLFDALDDFSGHLSFLIVGIWAIVFHRKHYKLPF
jgi:hypothetical protein